MKRRKIFLLILGLIFLLLVSFWLVSEGLQDDKGKGNKPTQVPECQTAADCGFLYTGYEKDYPCPSCTRASETWVCRNKERAKIELREILEEVFGGWGKAPLCQPCMEDDYHLYSCQCLRGQCDKIRLIM